MLLLLLGLWSSSLSLIWGIVPQSPNPYAMDGDPCCGVPDTWAQTREWAFWSWLWLGAAVAVAVSGVLRITGAIRGRPPSWRWLPISVAAAMTAAGVAIVIAYVRLEEAPQVTWCREAREQGQTSRVAAGSQRDQGFGSLAECE